MKKIVSAATIAALMAGAAAITVQADDASEQMRSVDSFMRVRNKGAFDVDITVGPEQSVKVIADGDIIDQVETEVRGETLHIEMDRDFSWRDYRDIDTLKVEITVPALEAVRVDGSGDMEVRGVDDGDFRAGVNGSGDIELIDAKTASLEIDVKGSGDVEVSGSCTELTVEVKGSGDVSARSMECQSGEIGIMGSGDVSAYLSESIEVSIMGSGDVAVWGKPDKVRTRTMGSGDVVLR